MRARALSGALRRRARRAAAAALVCAGGAAAARAGLQPPEAHDLFYQGLYQEIGVGNLEGALAAYRAIASNPLSSKDMAGEALIREGICLARLGREAEALACYNRAIDRSPDSAAILEKALSEMVVFFSRPALIMVKGKEIETLTAEANRCLANGDLEEGKDKLQKALVIDPDNPELQLQMASTCRKLGRYKEAVLYYSLAMRSRRYRNNRTLALELAECYRKTQDYDSAIKLWRPYLEDPSLDSRARRTAEFELELLYEARDRPEDFSVPGDLTVRLGRAEEQTKKSRLSEAIMGYRAAAAAYPESYIPLHRLGLLYDYLLDTENKDDNAIRYYKEALKTAPPVTAQRLRCRIALLYERRDAMEEAYYYIERYFSRDIRPVENDNLIRERIRKRRMWERLRKLKTE